MSAGLTPHEGVSPTFVAPAIYRQDTAPEGNFRVGDLWIDISTDPPIPKQWTLGGWAPISAGGGGSMKVSAGTQSNLMTQITFADAGGVSFGLAGSVVTASAPAAGGGLTNIRVSAGTTSNLLSAFTFSNVNGVSFGLNASTLTGSVAAQSVQTQNMVSVQGSSGAISFQNSNGITFGGNASTITASHNGLTQQSTQPVAVSGQNGSFAFSTLSLSNANGISFGTSAGNAVTASHNALTVQSVQTQNMVSVVGSTGNISFGNANGITFGFNASTITGSVETSYAASNHSHGNPTLFLTNLSGTTNSNSAGFTLSLSAVAGGGGADGGNTLAAGTRTAGSNSVVLFSNANGVTFGLDAVNGSIMTASVAAAGGAQTGISGIQVSNTTYTSGTVTWQNANGISFGSSGANGISASYTVPSTAGLISAIGVTGSNGNFTTTGLSLSNANGISFGTSAGSAITASHNALTTARASNDGIGLNTAQTNVTWTVNSSGLSLNAAGYAGTATGFTGANISGTFTHNSVGLSLSLSVAPPGAAAENNAINLLGANTAGNTTVTGSTLGFSGLNLTLSGTNNSQLVISAPATSSIVGVSGVSLSSAGSTLSVMGQIYGNWEPIQANVNTTFSSLGQNSLYMQKILPNANYSFNNFEVRMSGSFASSTNSQVVVHTIKYGLYSLNGNTYSSLGTSQMVVSASYNSNTAMGITMSQGAGSYTTTSGGTAIASLVTGFKHLYLPFTSTLTAGVNYAFGINISSATTVGTSPLRIALLNQTVINNLTIGKLHATTILASNASFVGDFNQAVGSVTTGAMPSSIANADMTNAVSQAKLYMQLD